MLASPVTSRVWAYDYAERVSAALREQELRTRLRDAEAAGGAASPSRPRRRFRPFRLVFAKSW